MSLNRLKELVSTKASDPSALLKSFVGWVRWRGGLMDTYFLKGTEKSREQAAKDGDESWAYRYPAPGSIPPPTIPYRSTKSVYDITYLGKDVRRNPSPFTVADPDFALLEHEKKKLLAAVAAAPPKPVAPPAPGAPPAPPAPTGPRLGSPGNNNPDVYRYSKDGLRSAMTATHAGMNSALAKVNQQRHLPRYEWSDEAEAIINDFKSKDLPPVPGRPVNPVVNHWAKDPRW